ncbi:MAG: hypothetical protein GX287_03495 [Fusobacteria bacterium]|nr:hypothetical protein [Fusobacteriota bacterium]
MHLKLLVISHKPKFGSIMRFCGELTPEEKLILDSIIYRKYPHNTSDINEININSFHVYFMVFFGGKDEFGRDYRIVISSIFPFALSVKEGQKLKLAFHGIKDDITNNSFKSTNKYYADIKKKVNWDFLFPKKLKLHFFLFWGINFIFILLLLASLSYFKPVRNFYKYLWTTQYYLTGRNNYKKYQLSKDIASTQELYAKYWLEKADNEKHYLITRFIRENPDNISDAIVLVEEYLDTKEYILHRQEFLKLKRNLKQQIK